MTQRAEGIRVEKMDGALPCPCPAQSVNHSSPHYHALPEPKSDPPSLPSLPPSSIHPSVRSSIPARGAHAAEKALHGWQILGGEIQSL